MGRAFKCDSHGEMELLTKARRNDGSSKTSVKAHLQFIYKGKNLDQQHQHCWQVFVYPVLKDFQ